MVYIVSGCWEFFFSVFARCLLENFIKIGIDNIVYESLISCRVCYKVRLKVQQKKLVNVLLKVALNIDQKYLSKTCNSELYTSREYKKEKLVLKI